MDKNLQFQQNLAAHAIAVVLIRARSNRVDDLRPLVPQILAAVAAGEPGAIRYPGGGGWMCLAVVTSLEIPAFGVVTRTFVVRGVARAEGLSDASLSPGDYRAYALLGEGPRELLLRSPAVRFQVR